MANEIPRLEGPVLFAMAGIFIVAKIFFAIKAPKSILLATIPAALLILSTTAEAK